MASAKQPPEISLQSEVRERQTGTNCHGGHGQVHNSLLDTICVHEQALLEVLRKHDEIMSEMRTKLHDIKSLFAGNSASFDEASFCATDGGIKAYDIKPQLVSKVNVRQKSEERSFAATNDHVGIENLNASTSDDTRCMLPTMAGKIQSASPEHLHSEDNTRALVNGHSGNAEEKKRLEL